MKLKIGDYFVIIFFIITIALSFRFYKSISTDSVEIITPYKKIILPLNKNRLINIKGKIGNLLIEIKDKRVRVVRASCPNKICVKTGWISKNGEYIACVPNKVIIKLISTKHKKNVDFITQ